MKDTILQAARELQIAPVEIKTVEDAHEVTFKNRRGDNTKITVKDGERYKEICERMKDAHRAKNQT